MRLAGFRTKTEAIDWALRSAERSVRRERLFAARWAEEDLTSAVDPSYDPLTVRHAPDAR